MRIVRSAAVACLAAAALSLAPQPWGAAAEAAPTRCTAYQPGDRTPERRQLMENLLEAINRSPNAGTRYSVKRLWLSCDYARVQLRARGGRQRTAPPLLDALMVKVNGEWRFDMFAETGRGTPGSQYVARHPDIPEALIYW